jgi:hypothetical protein
MLRPMTIRNAAFPRSSFVVVIIACIACIASVGTPAHACDPNTTLSLAGFDDKGNVLVRRDRESYGIDLATFALATGKEGSVIDILTAEDPEAERPRLRAKRWKEAEAKLVKAGFTINPKYPVAPDDKLGVGDFVIVRTPRFDEETSFSGTELTAKKGAHTVELVTSMTPPSDAGSFGGVFVSPDKRTLVVLESGCLEKVHVFSVAQVSEKLAAAAKSATTPAAAKP